MWRRVRSLLQAPAPPRRQPSNWHPSPLLASPLALPSSSARPAPLLSSLKFRIGVKGANPSTPVNRFVPWCNQHPIHFHNRLMESLISSLNNMEMETSEAPESAIQLKPVPEVNQLPVKNDVNPEKETDELPGSEANLEPVEKCQETVMETVTILDKQADPEAGFEVNQKPSETCLETSAESDVNTEKQAYDPGVIYRCKKCRRMLATQEFVVTHEIGAGGKCFNRGKRSEGDDKSPECPSIFVEPMKWMQTVEEGHVANKLFCMGCKARLGQFNWAGMQCCCGAWVIPAFQLTKSKIDECSM